VEKLFASEIEQTVTTKVVDMNETPILIKHSVPALLRDDLGSIVLQVFRKFLTTEDKERLLRSTQTLCEENTKWKPDVKRGVDQVFHFDCWRKYAKSPFVTSDSRTTHAQNWIMENRPLF
jgi:hypothetical protein